METVDVDVDAYVYVHVIERGRETESGRDRYGDLCACMHIHVQETPRVEKRQRDREKESERGRQERDSERETKDSLNTHTTPSYLLKRAPGSWDTCREFESTSQRRYGVTRVRSAGNDGASGLVDSLWCWASNVTVSEGPSKVFLPTCMHSTSG